MGNGNRVMSTESEPQSTVKSSARTPNSPRSGWRVSRAVINFWVDVGLLIMFVTLAWVTAVLQFVFPAAADATGWSLWGWTIVDWRNAQFVLLCIFAGAIVLHVMLHWTWVVGILNQRIFRRTVIPPNGIDTLIGVGLLLAILHALAAALLVARYYAVHP